MSNPVTPEEHVPRKPTCGAKIEKDWPGHRVVLWRKYCKHHVKVEGDRCWQHQGLP